MKMLVILVLTLGIVSVIANPVSKQTIRSENKNSPQAETSDSQTKHEEVINTLNKGDQEQKKDKLIENPATPNNIDISKDINEKVEIIIEEDIASPTDEGPNLPEDCPPGILQQGGPQLSDLTEDNPQIQAGFVGGPQLPGDYDGDLPFPGFIEEQMSGLNKDLQQPGFFVESPQVSGFVEGIEQLPGIIGDIPQLSGIIDNGPSLPEDDEDDFITDKDYFREDMQKVEHEIMETAAGFIPTPLVFRRKQKPRRRFVTRRHFRRNPYRRHQFIYPYGYYAFYRPSSLRYY